MSKRTITLTLTELQVLLDARATDVRNQLNAPAATTNGKPAPAHEQVVEQATQQLAQLLHDHRLVQGVGLRDAARAVGVTASTLSRVENGGMADLATFYALCKWLGLSADELLGLATRGKQAP